MSRSPRAAGRVWRGGRARGRRPGRRGARGSGRGSARIEIREAGRVPCSTASACGFDAAQLPKNRAPVNRTTRRAAPARSGLRGRSRSCGRGRPARRRPCAARSAGSRGGASGCATTTACSGGGRRRRRRGRSGRSSGRAGARPSGRTRRSAAAHPDGAFADVVGGRGETELRPGDRQPERCPLVEVRQELMQPDLRRAGVAPLLRKASPGSSTRNETLPLRGSTGPPAPRGRPPRARPAAADVSRPDVEAAARERARRVGDPAAVAAPRGSETTCSPRVRRTSPPPSRRTT